MQPPSRFWYITRLLQKFFCDILSAGIIIFINKPLAIKKHPRLLGCFLDCYISTNFYIEFYLVFKQVFPHSYRCRQYIFIFIKERTQLIRSDNNNIIYLL